MHATFRRAQLSEAYDLVVELATKNDKTLYPETQQRLLGLAYLLQAVSDEMKDWGEQ